MGEKCSTVQKGKTYGDGWWGHLKNEHTTEECSKSNKSSAQKAATKLDLHTPHSRARTRAPTISPRTRRLRARMGGRN